MLIRNAEELKNFSKGEEEQLEKVRLKLLFAVLCTFSAVCLWRILISKTKMLWCSGHHVWVIDHVLGQDGWILAKFCFLSVYGLRWSQGLKTDKKNEMHRLQRQDLCSLLLTMLNCI